ncbi:hypothetical protein [Frankia sp. QA3]|uniref:hypothetical protein n=1 Tax=Frankia sp. QA3 TaxID=710111 RepID=UPI000269C7E7|nr:hypothetical protein [Frankia sp. QA3]EIV93656.1 hypothetical protein FraQA3DRAFT_3367 [Frankia sp. QA3]
MTPRLGGDAVAVAVTVAVIAGGAAGGVAVTAVAAGVIAGGVAVAVAVTAGGAAAGVIAGVADGVAGRLRSRRASGSRQSERASGSLRGWVHRANNRGERRRLPQMCGNVDRLVDHLLARAVQQFPEHDRDRWDEEWADNRTHLKGWRQLWWALCVRATATRTAHELRATQLPHTTDR